MAVDNAEGGLVNNLFPVIRSALGLSLPALGIFASISRFARALVGPMWAMVADRYGRKRVLVFVTGIWGIWTVLAGFAQTYPQLLVLYTLGAIGTVACEPVANSILADMFASEERGKAYGSIRATTGLLVTILTPLIGRLANVQDGWRIGMYIMGGLSIFSGLLMAWFVKVPDTQIGSRRLRARFELRNVPQLLRIPTVLLIGGSLVLVTSLILFSYLVTYMVDVHSFTTADANIVLAAFALGMTVSSLVGGLLGDWFVKRLGQKGRIVLMQIYLVAFAIMSYLAMQVGWPKTVTYAVWFVFGLIGSIGFSGGVQPMVANVAPPEMSSTAFGLLFSFFQGLLSALFSVVAGFLGDRYGLKPVMLWLITVPYAINALYWFLFYGPYPKDVAVNQLRESTVK